MSIDTALGVPSGTQWAATFPHLKALVDSMAIGASVFTEHVCFDVSRSPTFSGIQIDQFASSSRSLMLTATLPCRVDVFTPVTEFTVAVATDAFMALLVMQPTVMYQREDSADLFFFTTASPPDAIVHHSIPTLQGVTNGPHLVLERMKRSYKVGVRAEALKRGVRTYVCRNASVVDLSLERLNNAAVLAMRSAGDECMIPLDAIEQAQSAFEVVYRGTHSATHLRNILTSLADDAQVALFLETGMPLILKLWQDAEQSGDAALVLASCVE
jgi:hypothetical protein